MILATAFPLVSEIPLQLGSLPRLKDKGGISVPCPLAIICIQSFVVRGLSYVVFVQILHQGQPLSGVYLRAEHLEGRWELSVNASVSSPAPWGASALGLDFTIPGFAICTALVGRKHRLGTPTLRGAKRSQSQPQLGHLLAL